MPSPTKAPRHSRLGIIALESAYPKTTELGSQVLFRYDYVLLYAVEVRLSNGTTGRSIESWLLAQRMAKMIR